MDKKLLIYGAGGSSRELAFSLSLDKNLDTKWDVLGFVDDDGKFYGKLLNGIPVLGGFEYLKNYSGNIAVCVVGNPAVKKKLILKIKDIGGITFPTIISSKSIVSSIVEWGEGCIISLPHNFISPNTKFGDFVFVNCGTRIGHDVTIGNYTTIFSGIDISGEVSIGSECVIGSGVTILPKIKIGDGSIIGGGSLVSKDIPPKVIAAGVPAKVIREIQ